MIYLDNAATTFPSKAAIFAFLSEAGEGANPSSLHSAGYASHVRLEKARSLIASTLFCSPEEITFTSGGTESANLAIFGAVEANKRIGNKILCSNAEHPCVKEPLLRLAASGFEVIEIPTRGGALDLEALSRAADQTVILACLMHVNNETGAVFDLPSASRIVKTKSPKALVFSDCVQSYLKEPLSASLLGADLISLSAHKIGGVRGVGALYHKKGVRLVPLLFGGGQEEKLRSGTENTPGIAAFAAAAEEGFSSWDNRLDRLFQLRKFLSEELGNLPGAEVLIPPKTACHIVSASFSGYKSEVLLHLLSDQGVFVSSGSACSSHKGAKSRVLRNYGLSPTKADSSLRFSLCDTTTKADLQEALSTLKTILNEGKHRL